MRASCTICGTKFANSRILSWHLKTHFPKISFELNKTTQACISCKKLSDLLNENLCYSCTMVTPLSSNFHFNFFDIFYSYRLCKKTSLDFCPSIFYSTQKFGHIETLVFRHFYRENAWVATQIHRWKAAIIAPNAPFSTTTKCWWPNLAPNLPWRSKRKRWKIGDVQNVTGNSSRVCVY